MSGWEEPGGLPCASDDRLRDGSGECLGAEENGWRGAAFGDGKRGCGGLGGLMAAYTGLDWEGNAKNVVRLGA